MNNLLDLSPLNGLNKNAKPLWGNMTPQHMVEHLVFSIQLSNGAKTIDECMTPEDRLPLMKKVLMSSRPLPRNFVNTVIGEGLKPLIYSGLELAKEALRSELFNFEIFHKENPSSVFNNPTFGPLNYEEWIVFHKKHWKHHFSQFGLVSVE